MTLDEYLDKVATFAGHDYGRMMRQQFSDSRGASELALLVCPSTEELDQLRRAVAIMTPREKSEAVALSDEQIQRIAADAQVDPGTLAIFMNGYALYCKRVS